MSRCKECRSKAADNDGGANTGLAVNLMGAKLLAATGLDMAELKKEVEERGGFARVVGGGSARAMGLPPNTCAQHLRRQFVAASNSPARAAAQVRF